MHNKRSAISIEKSRKSIDLVTVSLTLKLLNFALAKIFSSTKMVDWQVYSG